MIAPNTAGNGQPKRRLQAVILARRSPRRIRIGTKHEAEDRAKDALDRQLNGIDVQVADVVAYCERMGYDWSEDRIYREELVSGGNWLEDRPVLREAVKATERGMILVLRDVNRIARSLELFPVLINLAKKGAHLETIERGRFDMKDEKSLMVYGIDGIMGAVKRITDARRTSEKMRDHQSIKKAVARRMGSIVTTGHMQHPTEPGLTVPNPDELEAIELMKAWRVQGESFQGICDRLHGLGLEYRGGAWKWTTVRKILKREGV
jgi:DNA invertase Pin-like site-specific DNA recombinase